MTAEHEPAAHTVDTTRGHTVDIPSGVHRGRFGGLLEDPESVHGHPTPPPSKATREHHHDDLDDVVGTGVFTMVNVSASDVVDAGHVTAYEHWTDLLRKPAWQDDALCREYPHLSWFPERGDDVRQAIAVCYRCLVRVECGQYADDLDERVGIWGGLSANARRRHRESVAAATRKDNQ